MDAWIDKLVKEDEMHSWLMAETEALKENIRSGKMQEVYNKLFAEQQ